MKHDLPSTTRASSPVPGPESPVASLADYLAAHRGDILAALGMAVAADPELTSSDDLSRSQFLDHIPQVLDQFEDHLRERVRSGSAPLDGNDSTPSVEHGRHRWKQGYDLREVILEWGHLHGCLLNALEDARATLPGLPRDALSSAGGALAVLINTAIADSAEQFARLQQKDAIRAFNDLESAVERFAENSRSRRSLWRDSAHDLRGQLSLITSAASLLEDPGLDEPLRAESVGMLQSGTRTFKEMLAGLLEHAQMDTDREERRLDAFDAATLLSGLCAASQPLARERGLSLRSSGPARLSVEGDRGKVQRIAQNLLLNALAYTSHGGVTMTWQENGSSWWSFQVRDTGPGLPADGNRPRAGGTGAAGEGIGLAIVHRLSELLGARVEVESTPGKGTVFTVTLPARYAA